MAKKAKKITKESQDFVPGVKLDKFSIEVTDKLPELKIEPSPIIDIINQFENIIKMIPQYLKVYKQINPDSGWIFKGIEKYQLHPLLDYIYNYEKPARFGECVFEKDYSLDRFYVNLNKNIEFVVTKNGFNHLVLQIRPY